MTRPAIVVPCRSTRPASRRGHLVARAAEVQEEAAEADAAEEPGDELTALERARAALDEESMDKDLLVGCMEDLEDEMEDLRAAASGADTRSKTLEASIATAKDQYLRLNADFDNFRRRSKEENAAIADSVKTDVVKDLLPLIDNFELARTNVKAESEAEQKINNSYQSLYKQMVDIIRALGVDAVPTVGTPFDPNLHEAIMREPSTEHPDGTVLQEFRKGFALKDKLLRPAMVKVSFTEDGPTISSTDN